ncbi:MAG: hypothetical protein CVT77_08175 [Alphaproteobacteria bacterium HGW-Alphaproteobacteria-16]|nr:MAG: hypothetical protein CVT77_08175 [Alphaproteobacteria bacterium HGW-Alphaproteobacteria-16]
MSDTTEYDDELEKKEEALAAADETDETPPADIVAFNELRSCSDLKRLYDAGQLDVQPDYQRDIVWQPSQQTRFIDSLAKQLPIPSMCISLDYKTEKRQIVDGLQRMSAIIKFLSDGKWRLSNLQDIDKRIVNKTVEHIERENPEIYSRVQNTVIPVTVLRCDLSKRSHQEYLFTIFHRLNTGGMKLNNQEIRNCIYSGSFNDMLKDVVASQDFVDLFDVNPERKYRFSNEELILRILAFSDNFDNYKGPLSKHLNAYMAKFREKDEKTIDAQRKIISDAVKFIYNTVLDGEPLPRLSKATSEALFVGVIRNQQKLLASDKKQVKKSYKALRSDPLFSIESLKEGLAAPDRVKSRLTRAVEIFSQ